MRRALSNLRLFRSCRHCRSSLLRVTVRFGTSGLSNDDVARLVEDRDWAVLKTLRSASEDGELVLTVLRCVSCGHFAELDVDVVRGGVSSRVTNRLFLRPDEAFAIAGNPILYPAG